jgi:cholesterol oxidase
MAKLTGGIPATSLTEIFLNIPMTAHCLGGAPMAADSEWGVVDEKHRVFGYENMLICDGSVVSSNLGVNPSLTITALSERAMSYIPTKELS